MTRSDIVGLLDSSGNLVVEYRYDAWGKPVSVSTLSTAYDTLASLNPFRYRGYVWDEETGWYYLRSRYYNPEWSRFINADILLGKTGELLSHNGFAYCNNDVIIDYDIDGLATYYIIYDARPNITPEEEEAGMKGGFVNQAIMMACESLKNENRVIMQGFHNLTELSQIWEDIDEPIDRMYILAHGSPGTIDCNQEQIGYSNSCNYPLYDTHNFSHNAVKEIYLFTCNGATPGKDGTSVADWLCDLTGAQVYAAYRAKVNYHKTSLRPYAVPDHSGNIFSTIINALTGGYRWIMPVK